MTPHTLNKAGKFALVILTAFAVLYCGDQVGWLDAEAWIDLRPDRDLQFVLVAGTVSLLFVFGDELKLTNNLDEHGRAIEDDERARRAGNRSPVAFIAALVIAKLLFEVIVFFGGT